MNQLMVTATLILGLSGMAAQAQSVRFRAAHFAPLGEDPAATSLDISVDGLPALQGMSYGDFTEYFPLSAAGSFTLEVFRAGSSNLLIWAAVDLGVGDTTLVLVGDDVKQPLQLLMLHDDNSAPTAGHFKFRLIHAASFAQESLDTMISVRTGGGEVLSGLEAISFGNASQFVEVPAGEVDLKFSSPDGLVNLIDPLPFTADEGAIITLVATGNGSVQPLAVSAIPMGDLTARVPVDSTGTGIYFNPATAGQGAQMQVFPRQNRILGFMYTYDTAGQSQVWYHFDSCNNGETDAQCQTPGAFDGVSAPVTYYLVEGGVFNQPSAVSLSVVGTGAVTFESCDEVALSGDVGNGAGEFIIDYLRLGDRAICTEALQ